ncbi:hypothetical protein JTB14_022367 [Gonioctena quinquepunctata]|nr:hypothetical protein JTB14_022367 [Gonioctena quinquepunctata]
MNPKAPEGPSSEIAGVEQQQQGLTTGEIQVHGKCSENPNLLETPSELSKTENKTFGKCGENPIVFQKPLETAKELITQETQGNVLSTPLAGNQMMLAVRQQKERAQAQAELDRQIAYVSEYQAEANNDQIIEAMDYQTTPCIVAEVARVCQENLEGKIK